MASLIRQPYRFIQLQVSPGFLLSHVLTSEFWNYVALTSVPLSLPTPRTDLDRGLLPLVPNVAGENRDATRQEIDRATTARDDIRQSYANMKTLGSSPPPLNRNAGRDNPITAQDNGQGSDVAGTAYIQTAQPTVSYVPTISTSDTYYNPGTYNAADVNDYRQYQGGVPAASTLHVATSGSYIANSGYYQAQTNYSVVGSTQGHSGFFPIADQQRNDWLAANDSTAFVFGEFIQTLRGADILATGYPAVPGTAGKFKVFMPDWFGDEPADLANYPPKTPAQFKYIKEFMTGPADPSRTLPRILPLLNTLEPPTRPSKAGQSSDSAGAANSPLLEIKDAERVRIPHCVLPSVEEVPEVEALLKASPKSYSELFEDQIHGWMSSRADFDNLRKFEEYLRGYRIVRAFFNEHL
ncbi:hypothetical protein VTL71DRAFT_12959 [Oculimacula yallundae]|uniref:Uncharacterized protein n=1 Tax=Oculimacula yallundae TaxID=86028 RepID=A0ABR4CP63_9HELO